VLDDLDDLLARVENVMLLKCLCDTQPVKVVAWGSNYREFRGGTLPKSFESISRLCLICNDWQALNRNIVAVHDRGLVVYFQPSAVELHKELAQGGWFDDEEVFNFIGRNLFLITEPSFRFYLTAREHKRAGLDWQSLTLRTIETDADPKDILIARLLSDPQYETEVARLRAFQSHSSGGSKATYHRHKAELLARRGDCDAAEIAAIKLAPARLDLHLLAQRDRRQQIEEMFGLEDEKDSGDERDRVKNGPEPNIDPVSRLRREMQRAIVAEKYELASKIRDEIRRLEKEQDGQAI
jgi:hypothetical protein